MKGWTILQLAVASTGMLFLAWNEYGGQRADAEQIADPAADTARQWADHARLDCAHVREVKAIHTRWGHLRPMSFICWTGRKRLAVNDVECPHDSYNAPLGQRTPDGLYKPVSSVCWSVTPLP